MARTLIVVPHKPDGSLHLAASRVECIDCGGGAQFNLSAPLLRGIVEALADAHQCPPVVES